LEGIGAYPEFARVEIFEDGGETSGVIGVGVGGDDDVEAADTPAPEIGGDDVFAGIEAGTTLVSSILEDASPIDEHFRAVGKEEEEAVALADIDGGEFEKVARDRGR
jgi:hypothetical protein